jgi:hypothetical protein
LIETVTHPLWYGTLYEVCFREESGTQLVDLDSWINVTHCGTHNDYEDGGGDHVDILNCTNKLALNVGLMQLDMETVEGNVTRVFQYHYDSLNSLGSKLCDMLLHSGDNPWMFTDGNIISIWEGMTAVNDKVEGAHQQLALNLSYVVQARVRGMHTDMVSAAKADAVHEVQVSMSLVRNNVQAL